MIVDSNSVINNYITFNYNMVLSLVNELFANTLTRGTVLCKFCRLVFANILFTSSYQ